MTREEAKRREPLFYEFIHSFRGQGRSGAPRHSG